MTKKVLNAIVNLGMMPIVASAAIAPKDIIQNPDDITTLFCKGLLWMFWGLIVFSVVMFLVGGYTYATSAGDAEKVSKATKTLTYAAIGVVVALLARSVPIFIGNIFIGSGAAGQLNVCNW